MSIVRAIYLLVRGLMLERGRLAAENLALRQQVAVLKHRNPRSKLGRRDRIFWVWLSRLWAGWRVKENRAPPPGRGRAAAGPP